jgi:hypothetical protein
MEDLLVDEPQLLIEIIQLFIQDATVNLEMLRRQASLSDEKAVSMTLHALKGSCRQIGGLVMGDMLEKMEASLPLDGVEAVRESVVSLELEFQRLHLELQCVGQID